MHEEWQGANLLVFGRPDKEEVMEFFNERRLIHSYAYHHGYFDGNEREFRGFGRIEMFDSEDC
jgi:hypothetical protein